jgi:DHA1 family bicyclomycin/chloramphenicol resistance-like MFS transporter
VLVFHGLQETRTAADRRESSLASALSGYWLLLRDRHYLGLVFIGGCSIAGFFVYLASSPFVLINHYGLTPVQYSLAFSVNAAAFFAAAQFTAYLGRRFGLVPTVKVAVTGAGAVMVTMLSYYLAGGDRLAVLLGLYFVASGLMGLVIPSTSVLALEEHGAIAGTASALLGTLQMLIGAAAMGLVGLFSNGKPLPMVVGMASGALMGLALTWITLGRHRVAGSPDNQSVL